MGITYELAPDTENYNKFSVSSANNRGGIYGDNI